MGRLSLVGSTSRETWLRAVSECVIKELASWRTTPDLPTCRDHKQRERTLTLKVSTMTHSLSLSAFTLLQTFPMFSTTLLASPY